MTKATGVGKGGKRAGAGRPLNPLKSYKIAAELLERNRRMYGAELCPTPLEFLMSVLWDEAQPFEVRLDCAKTAAPYCHPRLQAVAVKSEEDQRLTIVFQDFSKSGDTQQLQHAVNRVVHGRSQATTAAIEAVISDTIAEDDAAD